MITKTENGYLDERSQEIMDFFAFCYDPKTLKVLAYGSHQFCKVTQKDNFVKNQIFYPITKVRYINDTALTQIQRQESLEGLLTDRGHLRSEHWYNPVM